MSNLELTAVAGFLGAENLKRVSDLLEVTWGDHALGPVGNLRWFSLTEPDTVLSDMEGFLLEGDSYDAIDGYIEITATFEASTFKIVVRPTARSGDYTAEKALITAALEHPIVDQSTPIRLWVREPTDADDQAASASGFSFERNLFHMSRSLNDVDQLDFDPKFTTRAFRPGVDEQKWLDVNNAAFATHPEQGNWSLSTLREHTAHLWFSPEGFLIHDEKKKIAAFCWTKIDPIGGTSGEIYVIAVDPKFHGKGLGKQITIAAMRYLHSVGCDTVDLYVDSASVAALSLYESLGFTPLQTDRCYLRPPNK